MVSPLKCQCGGVGGQWHRCGATKAVLTGEEQPDSQEQQVVQKPKDPEPLTKPVGSLPRWGRGEIDVGGCGAVSPGAIPVPLVQGPLGLTQLFSLISPSHSALGIPKGFWEHRQGRGI